jgi:salicylate hydroxylase
MMPWFGQGAASALEDAVVLGRCVMDAGTIADAPPIGTRLAAAFRRYERTRHARVTLIHHESAAGGERLSGMQPERLRDQPVRNEDSLGLLSYDPVSEALA